MQKFYSFIIKEGKSRKEKLDVFLKIVSDLESLEINISEKDQVIYFMNSLPYQCS